MRSVPGRTVSSFKMLGPMQVIAYFSSANTTDTNFIIIIFFLNTRSDGPSPSLAV